MYEGGVVCVCFMSLMNWNMEFNDLFVCLNMYLSIYAKETPRVRATGVGLELGHNSHRQRHRSAAWRPRGVRGTHEKKIALLQCLSLLCPLPLPLPHFFSFLCCFSSSLSLTTTTTMPNILACDSDMYSTTRPHCSFCSCCEHRRSFLSTGEHPLSSVLYLVFSFPPAHAQSQARFSCR